MSTGPNQILVKRSDSAGVQPSGLSFGEPAINSADGRLFFSQQTNGTPSGDLWEFRGFTNEGFVASVNGSTGDITVSDIQVVGVSDIDGNAVSGETFANTNELSFNSLTPGLTLSASQTANKTLITWDALDIASRIGVLSTSWTYTSAADITIPSTGNIRHQTGLSRLLIHQVDSGGSNTRTTWATVRDDIENYGTSIIRLSFGDEERNYTVNAASYSSPVWTFTISDGNSQTGGGGKSVNAGGYVNPGQNTRMSASEFYRFPDGTTTESIVTSFNGVTGDVNTSGLSLHVAGISSDGGITVGGMNIGGVSERLVSSSDVDDFVNFGPNKYEVYQNNARMFKADGTRTYIGSSGTPKDLYVYGELHGYSVINAQAGISLDAAGITFPDGTFQSTAASSLVPDAGLTLNGSTLDIDPTATIHVAGISSDGGITVGGDINTTNDFHVVNADGDKVFDLSTRNVKIGDCDGAGNSTSIFVRDSHNVITQTAATSISLLTPNVPINSKLSHNGDSDTHLDFSAANTITLTAGGVILANLTTAGFAFPQGISLDASGITFPDGTFQSTAASGGGGGGGITQSIGFILDGSGAPLTTGEKLDALKQVPYGSSVLSTAAYIQDGVSGTDKTIAFSIKKASALSSVVSGTTLEIGATASADQTGFTFDGIGGGIHYRTLSSVSDTSGSTIGAGEWIYPVITGNSGDINKLQIFMTVIPT